MDNEINEPLDYIFQQWWALDGGEEWALRPLMCRDGFFQPATFVGQPWIKGQWMAFSRNSALAYTSIDQHLK